MVYISIYSNFTFMSADLYSCTADLYSWTANLTSPSDLSWKNNPNWCLTCCILTYTGPQNLPNHTKPYQTKPDDLELWGGIPNQVPSNFWLFIHDDLWPKISFFSQILTENLKFVQKIHVLNYWWQTDGRHYGICDSRVAFATEKSPAISGSSGRNELGKQI